MQARSLFPFFIEPASLFSFNTSFLSFIACCQNTNRKQTVTLINPRLARLHTQNVSPSPCRKISTALCSVDFFPVPFSLGSPGTRIWKASYGRAAFFSFPTKLHSCPPTPRQSVFRSNLKVSIDGVQTITAAGRVCSHPAEPGGRCLLVGTSAPRRVHDTRPHPPRAHPTGGRVGASSWLPHLL